eukprot:s4003_g5.t1
MRHLHASEVALANGLHPDHLNLSSRSCRLGLAAVGQLASPFQGAWVMANAIRDMHAAGIVTGPVKNPLEVLQEHARSLLQQRDQLLGVTQHTEPMQRLACAIDLWGHPEAAKRLQQMEFRSTGTESTSPSLQIAYVPKPVKTMPKVDTAQPTDMPTGEHPPMSFQAKPQWTPVPEGPSQVPPVEPQEDKIASPDSHQSKPWSTTQSPVGNLESDSVPVPPTWYHSQHQHAAYRRHTHQYQLTAHMTSASNETALATAKSFPIEPQLTTANSDSVSTGPSEPTASHVSPMKICTQPPAESDNNPHAANPPMFLQAMPQQFPTVAGPTQVSPEKHVEQAMQASVTTDAALASVQADRQQREAAAVECRISKATDQAYQQFQPLQTPATAEHCREEATKHCTASVTHQQQAQMSQQPIGNPPMCFQAMPQPTTVAVGPSLITPPARAQSPMKHISGAKVPPTKEQPDHHDSLQAPSQPPRSARPSCRPDILPLKTAKQAIPAIDDSASTQQITPDRGNQSSLMNFIPASSSGKHAGLNMENQPVLNGSGAKSAERAHPDQTELAFEAELRSKCQELESHFDQPDFRKGAVPGFSTKRKSDQDHTIDKRCKSENASMPHRPWDKPVIHHNCEHKPVGSDASYDRLNEAHHNTPVIPLHDDHQPGTEESNEVTRPDTTTEMNVTTMGIHDCQEPLPVERAEVFILTNGTIPQPVQVPFGHTAGQLVSAQAKLEGQEITDVAIFTTMDSPVPLSTIAVPGAIYAIHPVDRPRTLTCQAQHPVDQCRIPILKDDSRENLLWQQAGWVAVDEMKFYMQMAANSYPGHFQAPIVLPKTASAEQKAQCVVDLLTHAARINEAVYAPVLTEAHWFPIAAISHETGKFSFHAPPAEAARFREALFESLGDVGIEILPSPLPTLFAADCGFQTVGWMLSQACGDAQSHVVDDFQAAHWRHLFHRQLEAAGLHKVMHRHPLQVGGMSTATEKLTKLVIDHGVAQARSQECVDHIMNTLGHATIQKVLSSPNPWTDLKARTSMCKPPIRIVLVEELKSMLRRKMQTHDPVGRKASKVKHKQNAPDFRLKADQIEVPHGVFKQQDGIEIGQLQQSQIKSSSCGVLVTNIEEALPYFALQQPLSTEDIGLLVLDHQDSRLPPHHTIVKVPSICKATGEPLIATAALLQIGGKSVSRNMPAEAVHIQETPHVVIRIALYKDQLQVPWDTVCKGPVRQAMDMPGLRHLTQSDILDVWDRQFLSESMQKAEPANAALFLVNVRLAKEDITEILAQSGVAGCYFEPRTQDGRHPVASSQVIWLPKKSYAEAVICQQATKVPCQLVRSGNRYGIRVANEHAEQTHMTHRPEVVYLNGNAIMKFRVGPIPFGSSKQSIANLFRKWGWQARPLTPAGATRDKSGLQWIVQSTTNPDHWIYQTNTGDILITPEQSPSPVQPAKQAIIASDKTLQSLVRPDQQQLMSKQGDDPWLHQDPWKATSSTALIPQQLQTMETNMEKRLLQKLQEDDRMDVDTDKRVTELEVQVKEEDKKEENKTLAQRVAAKKETLDERVKVPGVQEVDISSDNMSISEGQSSSEDSMDCRDSRDKQKGRGQTSKLEFGPSKLEVVREETTKKAAAPKKAAEKKAATKKDAAEKKAATKKAAAKNASAASSSSSSSTAPAPNATTSLDQREPAAPQPLAQRGALKPEIAIDHHNVLEVHGQMYPASIRSLDMLRELGYKANMPEGQPYCHRYLSAAINRFLVDEKMLKKKQWQPKKET